MAVSYALGLRRISGHETPLPHPAAMILLGALRSYAQPLIDYHQHLLSPSAATLSSLPRPFTAGDLIALLDAAEVRRAVVLSLAY